MAHDKQFAQTLRIILPADNEPETRPEASPRAIPKIAATPRKMARDKLSDSEYKLYREFMSSVYDAVLITNWTGEIVDSNSRAEDFFRYDHDALCDLTVFDLIYGFDAEVLQRIHANLNNDQYTLIEEAYGRRRNQSLFPVEIATNKLHLGNEKHICFFTRDITLRKQNEAMLRETRDQLAKAERLEMAGSIAGHIAHDFNNLLSPILAYPDLIRQELPAGSRAHEDLSIIAKTAQQIADINQQLLALSRRAFHEQIVLNLNGIVENATKLFFRDKKINGVRLDFQPDNALRNIKGASQQLLRVIQNLCQNAMEAMGQNGTLTIRTENAQIQKPLRCLELLPCGEYVKLTIADTGEGIPKDIQDRIFDPFFTTKKADRQRGSGLGLSIVRGIVKDHNGFINLASAPGQGTTFTLYFPVCHESIAPASKEPHARGTETILVVDDDSLQVEVMMRLLRKLGYTAHGAHSGEEAIQKIQDKPPPNLILLDMVMGSGIDGAETYQRIKAINPDLKAIIVSGYAESPRVNKARELGVQVYLRKPVSLEKLSKAVRQELDRK